MPFCVVAFISLMTGARKINVVIFWGLIWGEVESIKF